MKLYFRRKEVGHRFVKLVISFLETILLHRYQKLLTLERDQVCDLFTFVKVSRLDCAYYALQVVIACGTCSQNHHRGIAAISLLFEKSKVVFCSLAFIQYGILHSLV